MPWRTLERYYVALLPAMGRRRVWAMVDISVPADLLEWYTAVVTAAWSLWLLLWYGVQRAWWPEADLSHPTNILNLAFALIPQWVWGAVGLTIGCAHLGTPLMRLRRRKQLLCLSCSFWLAITLTVLVRVPYSTGVIAYGALAMAAGLAHARLYVLGEGEGSAADGRSRVG